MPCAGRGPRRADRRAHRIGQDGGRRVRRAPGPGPGPQVLLHHADQGALQPEVHQPRPAIRPSHRGPAHRGQQHQWRRARGGNDHRGAAKHAVHRIASPGGPRLRRTRRGALPGRLLPRRGLGGSDHPPAGVGARGGAVRDGEQRRGVRRMAGPGPRRDHGHRGRAPAGAALAARAGREPVVRPVHRRRALPGQPRAAPGGPAGHLDRTQGPAPARPGRPPTAPVPAGLPAGRDRPPGRQRPAARDHVHLQPGRLRRGGPAVPGRRTAADHAGRGRGDPADRGAPHRGHPARGPGRPGLRPMARRAAARDRGPSRRDAARLQGGRGGIVRRRAGPRGVRHRDARARHQHARPGRWSSRSSTSGTARPTRT